MNQSEVYVGLLQEAIGLAEMYRSDYPTKEVFEYTTEFQARVAKAIKEGKSNHCVGE